MKQRIEAFDVIRAFSAILIVINHFAYAINVNENWRYFPFFYKFKNGSWGEITAVSIFFILSGATLSYNYDFSGWKEVISFYKKRWLSLFPTFYMVWFFIYLQNVLATKNFLYAADFPHLLLSLVGLDGYFYYKMPTFYSVGEWFLGAIVLLYLLFPVLKYLHKKWCFITTVILAVLFTFVLHSDFFVIEPTRNLITCIFSMWLGMLFMKYYSFFENRKYIAGIAVIAAGIVLGFKLPIHQVCSMLVLGSSLFLILFYASPFIYKWSMVKKCLSSVSKISYQIFILQHVLITWVLNFYQTVQLGWIKEMLLLALTLLLIYIFAQVLYITDKKVVEKLKKL